MESDLETDRVKQKYVERSLSTVRILANKLGVHAVPSDLLLDAAQQFAKDLMLVGDLEPARELIRADQAGARAFLALAEASDLSTAYKDVQLGIGNQPLFLPFAPVSMWLLEVIRKRRA